MRVGEMMALPWREAWACNRPGVVPLRGHRLGEAEQGFLDLLRDADAQGQEESLCICAGLGVSAGCA